MRVRTAGVALGVAGAGWFAARAAAGRIERNPDPFPYGRLCREPEGEEVLIPRPDGTLLRARAAGDGPPVVLAHGYAATLLEWNVVWDGLLAAGHRVIAFDQRGHGGSTLGGDGATPAAMAEDYTAVLGHFDVRDGVLVGHSMGGFLAVRALLDHPRLAGRLAGLVLFATWAGRIHDGAPQNRLQIPLLRSGLLERLARTRTGGLLFGAAQCGAAPSPAMIAVFRELFTRLDHRAFLPVVRAFASEDHYPRLGGIEVPTVVVAGAADRTTPPGHARRLAAGIPAARLHTVPGAGHMLNWEAPDALLDAVAALRPRTGAGAP